MISKKYFRKPLSYLANYIQKYPTIFKRKAIQKIPIPAFEIKEI